MDSSITGEYEEVADVPTYTIKNLKYLKELSISYVHGTSKLTDKCLNHLAELKFLEKFKLPLQCSKVSHY